MLPVGIIHRKHRARVGIERRGLAAHVGARGARGQRRPLYSSMECLGGYDIGGGCSGIGALVGVEVYLVERAVAVERDGMVAATRSHHRAAIGVAEGLLLACHALAADGHEHHIHRRGAIGLSQAPVEAHVYLGAVHMVVAQVFLARGAHHCSANDCRKCDTSHFQPPFRPSSMCHTSDASARVTPK